MTISSRLGSVERESLVGLLLSQAPDEALPKRLLAQVENIELLANRLVVELKFPEEVAATGRQNQRVNDNPRLDHFD